MLGDYRPEPIAKDIRKNPYKLIRKTLADIYLRNVFPEMKVTRGLRLNNLEHNDFPAAASVATTARTPARTV
jgi:hypothetical protein